MVLYGHVYDVTSFLSEHPGGSRTILRLAGTDATEEYDGIHPPGVLEQTLPASAKLGAIDPTTLSAEPLQEQDDNDLETLLNIDDLEAAATQRISAKAWAYYYSAADDLVSKTLNTTAYRQILLRPRVLRDCSTVSTATTLLGDDALTVGLPIFASPTARARMAHPDGEWGIAHACAQYGALQIVSNHASMTPEQVVRGAEPGQVFGWQLYVEPQRARNEAALAALAWLPQYRFVCLTVDAPVPGKREHDERRQGPNVTSDGQGGPARDLTWRETLPWLAKHTTLPVVLKGIQTWEDACLASFCAPQVKAIILSNHGGRVLDTAPPAVHTLLEIRKYCPDVFDRVDVWVDGGIKRGTDVVKALCLGAKAVGVGRAALYGLGAGGKEGVSRMFQSRSTMLRIHAPVADAFS